MVSRCVIVGGGQAALQVAVSLRQGRYAGTITILSEEPVAPYQRPPLSKGYMAGAVAAEDLALRPAELYGRLSITLRTGTRAEAIDRAAGSVALATGATVPYDVLVLATGARPRLLPIPGADLDGVHHLRTLADTDALRARVRPGQHLAIIGGGYLGLEAAAAAARVGARVTVLEAQKRVMARVTGEYVAAFLTDAHRAHGVEVMTGAAAGRLERLPGERLRIALADGRELACDDVLVAAGVVPDVGLAEDCGLACDDGIVVDVHGRTGDPAVLAAGDCTNHPNPILGRRLRLESVHNAVEQAKAVARTILGAPAPYAQVPWFYSDQYGLKLQTVGLFDEADRVVIEGSPETSQFAALYLAGDRLVAVDAINSPRAFVLARKLLDRSPSGSVPLSDWTAAAGAAPATRSPVVPA